MSNKDLTPTTQTSFAALVKKSLSCLISQEPSNNGSSNEKRVARLRDSFSPLQLCSLFNPGLQAVLPSKCKSIHVATYSDEAPTLGEMARAYGDMVAVSFLKAQIIKINDFAGSKQKISDSQLEDLSLQIVAEYPYLNLLEIIVFCGRLRSGMYGEFYGSVDPMKILYGLGRFCKDREKDISRYETAREKDEQARQRDECAKNSISWEEWQVIKAETAKKSLHK